MAEIGDTVRYLNAVGGGRIAKIEGKIAYVDEPDGFTTPVLLKECVVVATRAVTEKALAKETPASTDTGKSAAPKPGPDAANPAYDEPEIAVEEVPGGDSINLQLAFEPTDIKKLSTSGFETFLVNDSNYYIYFSYSWKAGEKDEWQLRYSGIVEPNIQFLIEEIPVEALTEMDHISLQAVAFKRDREFALKPVIDFRKKIDTTKFAKLHCFAPTDYFESQVMAFDIVKDDKPVTEKKPNVKELEKALKTKKAADMRRRPVVKKKARQRQDGDKLVVDLHIHELVDNTRGMSNADMLNLQIDEFSRVMDENLRNKGRKIIFIHGKGEGVLRNAIMKGLNHRYKGHDVQDASFREYGFGATQVTI